MTLAYRFDIASKRVSTLDVTGTAAASDLVTDTLYMANGAAVAPLFRGAAMTGRWRSPIAVRNGIDGFGWAAVHGDFGGSATMRLYADDVLRFTGTLSPDVPKRLPPGGWREWEIELEGVTEMTSAQLAGSSLEMLPAGVPRAA